MKVHAAAGLDGEGLGHHREHHAFALDQLVRGHFEEHQVVGAGQLASVVKFDLKLAVSVFMVGLKDVQAAGGEAVAQLLQKLTLTRQAFQVVRRFVELVVRIKRRIAFSRFAQQKKLGLDAGAQHPSALGQARNLAAQHLTRAGVKRLTGHEAVANNARVTRHPRQGARSICIATAVVLRPWAGARQAGAPNGGACKTDAVTQPQIELV